MTAPRLRVYETSVGEDFEILLVANDDDYDVLKFDGQSRASTWKPVLVKRLTVYEEGTRKGDRLIPSDFPSCSGPHLLMLSGRTKEKLGAYLERFGELLPLACPDGEFWTLNVTTVIDALDEEKSKVLRARDEDRILMIHKYVFRASALMDAEIFRLPPRRTSTIFVTDKFVSKVRESGLVGLEFRQLWAADLN